MKMKQKLRSRRVSAEHLKSAIVPIEFYESECGPLPKRRSISGWVNGIRCPFHTDGGRPNFGVNLSSGGYHCFSCGASGGDIIDFVKQRDWCDFATAVETLSREWGVAS